MANSTSTATATSELQSSLSSSIESITSSIASSVSSAILSSNDGTTTVPASSTAVVTSVVSASSAAGSTFLFTSTVTPSQTSNGQTTLAPVVVTVTSESPVTTAPAATSDSSTTSASALSTSSAAASLQNNGSSNGHSSGLSTGGKTAIAVVVPVVVVALLVLAGLYAWRRRKQKKTTEEARRKEVEEYGFNPNNDPTLPAVTDSRSEMAEDQSGGYRGWGSTNMSNRKASTTLSGGHTQGQLSNAGSDPAYSGSPTAVNGSDGHSGDPLVNNRSTMSSDDLGALGAAPAAGANRHEGMKRGPSNASSSYSAGNRSDHSDPNIGQAISSDPYSPTSNYHYAQHGPYGDGSYGGGDGMPVVRDVSARRNTRIEQGGGYQQANSGIAQNF